MLSISSKLKTKGLAMLSSMLNHFILLFNRGIDLLKYPLTLLLLLSLPFFLPKLFQIIEIMINVKQHYYTLLLGMGSYIVVWMFVFRNIGRGWFSTLEHEFTHILFALLTFHKVTDLRATATGGGHMGYTGVGGGNWLISIAPYFFPTLSVLILGLMYLASYQFYDVLLGVFGFTLVYHIHSTWNETHYGQTDLQEVGFTFSWLFLPTANLTANIMLLSLIPNDKIYFKVVWHKYYDYCVGLLGIIF